MSSPAEYSKLAAFIKEKKLGSVSSIILDLLIPFARPVSAFLSVSEPFAEILFGHSAAEQIASFSKDENSLRSLKEALERGEK